MAKAFIKDIAYYLPQNVVTNEDIVADFPEWSVEKITNKVGVNQRHVADDNETATDMAVCAAESLFSKGICQKTDIDFILFCTYSKSLEAFGIKAEFSNDEPDLNRHWIAHGRMNRKMQQIDCIRLINFLCGTIMIARMGKTDTK